LPIPALAAQHERARTTGARTLQQPVNHARGVSRRHKSVGAMKVWKNTPGWLFVGRLATEHVGMLRESEGERAWRPKRPHAR
jgi:hypothetical protein